MIPRSPQRIRVSILAFLLFLGPWLTAVAADTSVLSGTVQRAIDGETVDVKLDSGRIRVRLNAIVAPEKS